MTASAIIYDSTMAAQLGAELARRARAWYPDLAEVSVRLLRTNPRSHSLLHCFELAPGRAVMVKSGFAGGLSPADLRREYAMLVSVHRHFSAVDDERLAAVKPLAYLEDFPALVMEFRPEPTLRALASKWFGDSRRLEQAFHDCGAWLRAFHDMPLTQVPQRRPNRDEFCRSVAELIEQLEGNISDPALLEGLQPWVEAAAARYLPESFSLVLKHGDYAMRNVLVGETKTLALDIGGRWRTSHYEDLAYFLTQMHTARTLVLSNGLMPRRDQLAACEQRFLEGYGSDAVEPRSLLVFRVRALLDRWATIAGRESRQPRSPWSRLQDRQLADQLQGLRTALEA